MPNDYYRELDLNGDRRPIQDSDAQEKLFYAQFKYPAVAYCNAMFRPELDVNNNLFLMPNSTDVGVFDWTSDATVVIITFDRSMDIYNNKGNKLGFTDNNERYMYPIYKLQNQSSQGYIYAGGTFLLTWHRTGTLPSGKPDGYFLIGDIQDAFGVKYDNTNSGLTADNVNDAIDELTAAVGPDPDKMDKVNPTGSGALSINRAANSTVGNNSVAVGDACEASGAASFAEGNSTEASGDYSHAEGGGTQAAGNYSHAEGADSSVFTGALCAHVEGYINTTSGSCSHVEGYSNHCSTDYQHVFGKNSIEDVNHDYVEVVGNGTSSNARSNARVLKWNGDETIAGDFFFNGNNTSLSNQLSAKQDKLTAGSNISISSGVISATFDFNEDISGQVSVPYNTWTKLKEITLSKGLYIIHVSAVWQGNANGTRQLCFSNSSTPGEGGRWNTIKIPAGTSAQVTPHMTIPITVTANSETWYLHGYQNAGSGTSLTAYGGIQTIKLT